MTFYNYVPLLRYMPSPIWASVSPVPKSRELRESVYRATMLVAVLAMALVHGSGARQVIPGLKSQTRSAVMLQVRRPPRGRRPVARGFYDGRKSGLVARLLGALEPHLSPASWLAPVREMRAQRANGQDGSMGVACGLRWTVLGGSGRLGPGATI